MEISTPNENGVLSKGCEEVVARRGRSNAAVSIAHCDDGLYRQTVSLLYSYGGFCGPIRADDIGYATLDAARTAGLEELLRRWPRAFDGEPQSVHDELADLHGQVEAQLRQPSLF